MASSSSTSANSTSTSTSTLWDVFLSFRGIDTRAGFVSHLHSSLHRTGIRTFIDDPELRAGDVISSELLNAIKQSKVYIVVLSKNYASSGWCLDELVEILRCWKSMGRLVLPIFYNIEPSVARHQIGSFKEAFEKHEGRVAIEIVNKWRGTLKDVADFSGYHVRDEVRDLCIKLIEVAASGYELCENRHLRTEAEIINEVVDRVLLQINPATLEVAKYPVGIDSRVADIESMLCSGSSTIDGVHWFGIHGMGGVGKTTLAKAFYNRMIRNYEGSCFLADVKDICAGSKCHVYLQQQLIDDVLKRKNTTTINNIDRGINLIRERIGSLQVLVVLDDIDHRNQVDYLVRNFVAGSVIILTTRNEDLLETLGVKARYRVNMLGSVQSWQLFKWHAFGDNNEIKDEFMEMSEEILHHAGGLPLALTVLGSSLKNKSKDEWRCFVEELLQVPVHDVEKSLMISFDALKLVNPKLQAFFLDIACFFVGQRKDYAVKILKTCYKFVNQYIIMLKERCFITINEHNRLSMHNLLSGMGRKIAGNSRLFLDKDIRDVSQNNKGMEAIEGMVTWGYMSSSSYSIDVETFNMTPNVRFLRLCYIKDIRGSFGKPFKDLRWLCWYGCPTFPSNFCADKLVILELRNNIISRIEEKALVLGNLKILDMSSSSELSNTPDFNGLPCLETLNLSDCESLVEVDVSVGNLERLATLDLSFCASLTSLPESICKLRALKSLHVSHCLSLKALPMELGNIESLTHLMADELSISQLPDSLGCLSKLVVLDLQYNRSLQSIPDTVCNLTSLESLNISGCMTLEPLPMQLGKIESLLELDAFDLNILNLPNSIGCLSRLVRLHLSLCMNLTTLPDIICKLRSLEILHIDYIEEPEELASGNSTQLSNLQFPSTLKHLKANNCMSLIKLPDLSNLQQLEKMHLSRCSSLREMEGLDKLISIKELHLEGCTSLNRLPDLSNLHQLEKMYLSNCSSLTEIEGLEKLTSLKELRLEKLILVKVLHLEGCTSMRTLHLKACSSLTKIEGFISVEGLYLEGCTSMERLPDLSDLRKLKSLTLTGWSILTECESLGKQILLRKIWMHGCTSVERLPNLSHLRKLEILQLTNCSSLTEIEGLEDVLSLTIIDLSGCISMKRLSNLSNLQQLQTLRLMNCSHLTAIEGLEDVLSITILDLSGCIFLNRLPNLSNLQKLEILELTDCSSLAEIQGLGEAVHITTLKIGGCKAMERLPNLSKLQQLKILQLSNCISLIEIEGLDEVISLTKLDLRGCISLCSLPDLSKLQNLQYLWLTNCSRLTEIGSVERLISVRELHLGGCRLVKRLPNLSNMKKLKSLHVTGLQ